MRGGSCTAGARAVFFCGKVHRDVEWGADGCGQSRESGYAALQSTERESFFAFAA